VFFIYVLVFVSPPREL